jgi:tRNA-splicing ligase RtcB (3'-phosphate/5'-hydroxy nucleic acid ligase)
MKAMDDKILSWASIMEPEAEAQVRNIASLPFVYKHVAVMPDAHLGKGACVGSVVATEGAVIPSCVGVDIGCGMIAVKTKFNACDLPDSLESIRKGIERRIPLGAGGSHSKPTDSAIAFFERTLISENLRPSEKLLSDDRLKEKALAQYGSLGSGNHFIEICLDQNQQVWIMLHSGSRGVGNVLAGKHIDRAKQLMKQYFVSLPDPELAYLVRDTPEFTAYIKDLLWCQAYALENRDEMMNRVLTELSWAFFREGGHEKEIELERVNCHHNFTQMENHFGKNLWITRKGAIQARVGQLGSIPGSMGTKSYIIRGKGNALSYESCSHGAGRRFSRNEARRRLTMADFDREMKGVECRRSEALIDELPSAYKDIDQVMEDQKDLVDVAATLKQVVSVKGD